MSTWTVDRYLDGYVSGKTNTGTNGNEGLRKSEPVFCKRIVSIKNLALMPKFIPTQKK